MRVEFQGEWVEVQGTPYEQVGQNTFREYVGKAGFREDYSGMGFGRMQHVIKMHGERLPEAAALHLTAKQHQELNGVMEKVVDIFIEPQSLLPKRPQKHAIHLLEGVGLVNVCPYQYPHHLKSEIEKQVGEMLLSRIIRPSHSAFSSSIILVKKKNGSWRMCVDYIALNKVIVPDKFPIPVIDELLDELHEAKYFSKIDLKSGGIIK